ncbi:MAG: hypothetical protein DCO96_03985 [Fluviicola sp. XM-24bin1]|nr:MAG: hypothetical protein DCO96_03985 [Fluviicola sp. XM-24bin1]
MRSFFQTNPLTKWSVILILTVLCITVNDKEHWKNPNKVISSDVKGYYGYLPALFINKDLKIDDVKPYVYEGDLKIWFQKDEQGRKYIKFPAGMAVMYSPFFGIAHMTSGFWNAPSNGYSEPYRFWLIMGSLFYTLLGLIFFSKLLLRHFNDRVTATTVLTLYLGTNLFYYAAFDSTFTHSHTFFLFSAFMYGSVRWIDTQQWKYVFLLGISGGLMVAIRHIDIWFLLFILLYGVLSWKDLKDRFVLFWEHKWKVLAGGALLALMMAPQIAYYLYIFGKPWHYAYNDETFFFTAPHLLDALFSYRNGWLLYTPIMIFAVIGMFFLRKRAPQFFTISIIGLPVYYYVLASWWCWWFVGFGNRAYINMYPLLALSFAALVSFLYDKYRNAWRGLNLLIIGAIVLNAFQSEQFNLGILHWDSETEAHYWHVFGKSERTQTQDYLLVTPHNPSAKQDLDSVIVPIYYTLSKQHFDFDNDLSELNVAEDFRGERSKRHAFQSDYGLFVPVNYEFAAQIPFEVAPGTTHLYISAWIKGDDEYRLVADATTQPFPFNAISAEVKEVRGEWRKIHMLTPIPTEANYSHLLFYIWNQNKKPYALDNLEVECRFQTVKMVHESEI